MTVLVSLLIFVVVAAVLLWILGQLPVEAGTKKILTLVVVALLLGVFLLRYAGPVLGR